MPVNYLTGKTLTYAILLLGLHGDLSAVLCLGVLWLVTAGARRLRYYSTIIGPCSFSYKSII